MSVQVLFICFNHQVILCVHFFLLQFFSITLKKIQPQNWGNICLTQLQTCFHLLLNCSSVFLLCHQLHAHFVCRCQLVMSSCCSSRIVSFTVMMCCWSIKPRHHCLFSQVIKLSDKHMTDVNKVTGVQKPEKSWRTTRAVNDVWTDVNQLPERKILM